MKFSGGMCQAPLKRKYYWSLDKYGQNFLFGKQKPQTIYKNSDAEEGYIVSGINPEFITKNATKSDLFKRIYVSYIDD